MPLIGPPRAFVIGHPIGHSRSPLIHSHWLSRYGIAGSYERIEIAPEAVGEFLHGFPAQGYVGGNVTIPHKERVFELVERPSALASRLGAVNTLWLEDGILHGDNTDVSGFIAHLESSLGPDWAARTTTALVLGAGGAARAIVVGLLDAGIGRILVANRSADRAYSLQALGPQRIEAIGWNAIGDALPAAQLVVNTTALGMVGQEALDIDLAPSPADAAICDAVYVPLETPLLAAARRRGLRTVDGLGMLLHQAVPGFARWFGVQPAVTAELRASIVADLGRPH